MKLSVTKLAFFLLIMLGAALACGDPEQSSMLGPAETAELLSPQPDFSANQAPLAESVQFSDEAYEEVSLSIARDTYRTVSQYEVPTVLSVPKFDPNLGELIHAVLQIRAFFASDMLSHARAPLYVSSEYNLGFNVLLRPDEVISDLIGRDRIGLTHNYEGSDEKWQDGIYDPSIKVRREKDGSFEFDELFLGTDAQVFVAQRPGEELTIYGQYSIQRGLEFLHFGAMHSGLLLASFLEIQEEPDGTFGGKPGVPGLILQVAKIVNASDDHGVIAYSDLHAAAAAYVDMRVTYLYQPNQPPDCSAAAPSVDALWPVNNKFTPIDVLGATDPDGDRVTINIDAIFQDEPTDTGESKFAIDGQGVGSGTAEVRAERVGSGNGRVYHIAFTAEDEKGAACSSEVLVSVPHDKKDDAVDDGALYDSTIP